MSVSGLLRQGFKLGHICVVVIFDHLAFFQRISCSLFGLGVLELLFELNKELVSEVRDVIIDWVQSVEPIAYVLDPLGWFFPFNKCQGEGNLLVWQVKPRYIGVDS